MYIIYKYFVFKLPTLYAVRATESMTPNCCKKGREKHSGRKNNCVQRKWESHSTKNMFLCCLAADSQIKAAVIWSNICIFLPFFIVCFSNIVRSRTHTYTETNAYMVRTRSYIKKWRQGSKHMHTRSNALSLSLCATRFRWRISLDAVSRG